MNSIFNESGTVNRLQPSQIDHLLIQRCLKKEHFAWRSLFLMSHPQVCDAIRRYLNTNDDELIEEIASGVWFQLIRNDYRLLAQFRADRGVRFTTFLAAVSRNVVRHYLRSERRRKQHEKSAAVNIHNNIKSTQGFLQPEVDEFIQSLTSTEQQFVEWSLGKNSTQDCFSTTRNSDYQLRHRTTKKLKNYFR